MFKRSVCFISLILLISISVFAAIDEIAIFNEQVAWSTPDAAEKATDYIVKNVKSAKSIKTLNKVEIADFVKKTYRDGTTDAIVLFGYLPETIYEPGNSQKDDSLIEKFINGGNIVVNTGDYIFYVTKGGGKNGENGLKTITNSNFDCFLPNFDNYIYKPTAGGRKYAPSLPNEYNSKRPMKKDQIDADKNWEIEISFGSAAEGISLVNNQQGLLYRLFDPVVVRSTKTGGRFVILRQTPRVAPDRGPVISEIIDNYFGLAANTPTALDPNDKITITWGNLKSISR